MRKFSNNSSV